MTTKPIFTGAATALVTPLTENGVDYAAFEKLINWQIDSGIDALVICGTTGEASTLTDEEHREVLKFAAKVVNGRVPIIAGTGSNDTAYAIDMTKFACGLGYDALWEDYEIATRPGAHCAPLMHMALGTVEQGAVRFSFSWFNTEEEVDTAINAVKELAQ